MKVITIKCKAFGNETAKEYKVLIEDNGTVRVYDSVAGYYTACHRLSKSQQRRIRRWALAGSK